MSDYPPEYHRDSLNAIRNFLEKRYPDTRGNQPPPHPYQEYFDLWFAERGDTRLLLNHKLSAQDVVVDLGAYTGEFAKALLLNQKPRIILFEPVKQFFLSLKASLGSVDNCSVFNVALSNYNGSGQIELAGDGSKLIPTSNNLQEGVVVRRFSEMAIELQLTEINLLQINTEGSEFEILEDLISSGLVRIVMFLQIQFHHFAPDAVRRRDFLRTLLLRTHDCEFNYPFVWEGWRIRK